MTISIMRQFGFDAGHRVLGHEGKCKNLHGHRYTAEIYMHAPELDQLGRVIDFGKVKELFGEWIDEHLDHNMILHPDDPLFKTIHTSTLVGRTPYVLMDQGEGTQNPTAENIAADMRIHLQNKLYEMHNNTILIYKIVLWETPNCCAIWEKS